MFFRKKVEKTKLNHIFVRLMGIILCLAVVCSVFSPLTAEAFWGNANKANYMTLKSNETDAGADGSTNNKKYVLITNTGTTEGKNIEFFLVTYKSTDGYVHSDCIFTSLAKKQAYNMSSSDYGFYRNDSYSSVIKSQFNNSEIGNDGTPLVAHAIDYFYFSPTYTFGELINVRCFGYYADGSTSAENEWYCNYAKIVEVDKVYGVAPVGTISRNYVPEISGTVVAEQSGTGKSYSWIKGSQLMDMNFKTVSGKTVSTENFSDIYYCQIDFADVFGAGVEDYYCGVFNGITSSDDINSRAKLTIDNAQYFDQLLLTVQYKDADGYPYEVPIPVLSTFLAEFKTVFAECSCGLYSNDWFDGLFRQNDTIGFACYLPFCSTITGFTLKNTSNTEDYSDLFISYNPINEYERLSGSVSVSGVRFYKSNEAKIGYLMADSTITTTFNNDNVTPVAYYIANSYEGAEIKNNSFITRDLTAYEEGDNFKLSTKSNNLYVINITTDNSVNAGTVDDLYFTLYYTKESTGNSMATQEKSIAELAKDYYGYWATRAESLYSNRINYKNVDNVENFYAYTLSPGKTISFFMYLTDVSEITGAKIRLDGSDEWQFSSISAYKVKDRGRITSVKSDTQSFYANGTMVNDIYSYNFFNQWYSWAYNKNCTSSDVMNFIYSAEAGTTKSDVKFVTDRNITRTFSTGKTQVFQYDEVMLVQADKSLEIDFSNGSSGTKEVDFSEYVEYMSYEESQQSFGFADSRFSYKVSVLVGNDGNAAAENGNCGSTDNFYFQLVFTNGVSGYVLANTQLYADGFRTGETEEFYISTNRDYGDLKAIHIIPESARDDAEPFDKLMISSIKVTKNGQAEVSSQWEIEVNSWISIDYSDSGAKDTVAGQSGSVESDLARTFSVTSSSYAVNVMVAITTGETTQISGGLKAYINYVDEDGTTKKCTVDVVKAICDYANQPIANEITVSGKTYNAVDNTFMFNRNQINRFTVAIDKLKSIKSIQFEGFANESYTWTASDIYFYTIKKEGRLLYSSTGEYINTADYEFLCSAQEDISLSKIDDAKYALSNTAEVTSNTVNVTVVDNSMSTEVTTYPVNKDDTMNVYVYMNDNSDVVSKYTMKGAVVYQDSLTTNTRQTSIRLNADSSEKMFYRTGIAASGLTSISSLTVLATADSIMTKAYPNYAVIEHVRSGVIISRSYFYFSNENCNGYQKTAYYSDDVSETGNVQYLKFMLTDDSQKVILENKVDDVAVSFTYVEKNGSTTHTLKTKNIFLSNVTDNTELEPGKIYTVQFNQEDISEITNVTFTAMGDAANKIGIKNAYIADYTVDTGDIVACNGWYSFSSGITKIKTTPTSLALTNNSKTAIDCNKSVSDVTVSIKTAVSDDVNVNVGTDSDVMLKLSYYDYNDNIKTIQYSDIKNYIVSGSTSEGDTLTLSLLVNNISAIHSVELCPVSTINNTDPNWEIEEVSIDYIVGGEEANLTRKVSQIATQDDPVKINFSDVKLSVNAYSYNKTTKKNISKVFSSTSAENTNAIVLIAGQTLTLTPSIVGSTSGVSCVCEKGTSDDNLRVDADDVIKITGNELNMSVDFSSDSEGLYYITFESKEFAAVKVTIPVKVENDT